MRFVRTTLPIALGFAAFATGLARAERADLIVPLNAPGSSQIAAPGDSATVGFLVTKGTLRKLTFSVKRGKGSKIVPEVALFDPDGLPFDIVTATKGKVSKAGAPAYSATFTDVPKTGLWRFEVRGGAGSVGTFTATVKGKDTLKIPAPKSPPETLQVNGKVDIPIEAGENTALTVSAKRAGGSLVLLQLSILDRNGNAVTAPVVANSKNGVLSLKGLRLPTFGPYTLRFSGGTTGGGFSYAASTAPAKIKGVVPTGRVDAVSAEPLLTTVLGGQGTPAAGGVLAYRWVQVSGASVPLANPDTLSPTFTAPAAGASLAFQFSVAEGTTLVSKPVTVSVDVAKRPIADAGRSQSVADAAAVALDGSSSIDRRGKGLKYSWRQIPSDASTVVLTGAATATPTLTAPNVAGVLHFGLTVDDGIAKSTEDIVVVNVGDPTKFVSDAGRDQYVPRMATVHLCGLASVSPTAVLDAPIAWTKISGPTVTLAGADTPWPSFTAPKTAADYVFKMTIAGNDAGADTVAVHVRPDETNFPAPAKGNGPLNAPPGNQPISAGATVDPNAADTPNLKFRWAQVAGAPLALSDASSSTANVVMVAGVAEYQFAVQAVDRLQYGAPDLVSVRSLGFTGKPIAVAGPDRTVVRGGAVSLDGRTSVRTDGGADPLSFQWTQVSCKDWFDFAASSLVFNPTVALPNVTLPADVSSLSSTRTVLWKLVVNDGTTSSAPDFVTVTYTSLLTNGLPTVTASASSETPIVGEVVTLQGTSFDRDGDPMTYQWSQTQGPPVALSPNSRALSPTFVAPSTSTPLKFTLVANDGIDNGPTSQVVTVTVDLPPVANIVVTPTNGPPGTLVAMDGAAASNPSSDPEGGALTYLWRQISGTSVGLTPTQMALSTISFIAPTGSVTFGLKVTDVKGQVSTERTAAFSAALPPAVNPTSSNLDTTIMPQVSGVAGFAAYGATVSLNANGSGGSGTLSYTWRVISQSPSTMATISISPLTTSATSFTVPAPTSAGVFGQTPQVQIGVTATDGTATSSEGTITIRFFASYNNGTASTTTQSVYAIISTSCLSGGCHNGTANTTSPNCSAAYGMGNPTVFLTNSRGVNACVSPGSFRLPAAGNQGQSSTSYLLSRLKGTASPPMPTGSPLSAAYINLIQDWIDQGTRTN